MGVVLRAPYGANKERSDVQFKTLNAFIYAGFVIEPIDFQPPLAVAALVVMQIE